MAKNKATKVKEKARKRTRPLDRLREYLSSIPHGRIDDADVLKHLESLLAACWNELAGDDGGMCVEKLYGRMEGVNWQFPNLGFNMERHDGPAIPRAWPPRPERQQWNCDLEKCERRFRLYEHFTTGRNMYERSNSIALQNKLTKATRALYDYIRQHGLPDDKGGCMLLQFYDYKQKRTRDGLVYEFANGGITFPGGLEPRVHCESWYPYESWHSRVKPGEPMDCYYRAWRLVEHSDKGLYFPRAAMELLESSTIPIGEDDKPARAPAPAPAQPVADEGTLKTPKPVALTTHLIWEQLAAADIPGVPTAVEATKWCKEHGVRAYTRQEWKTATGDDPPVLRGNPRYYDAGDLTRAIAEEKARSEHAEEAGEARVQRDYEREQIKASIRKPRPPAEY